MIFRLLALIALPILAWYGVRSLSQRFSLTPRQNRILFFIVSFLLVIGVLIVLGRLPAHFIIAPLGAIAAFVLRFLPTLLRLLPFWSMFKSRLGGARPGGSNQSSKINTEYFSMELEHESGKLDGRILKGSFVNRALSSLGVEELARLYQECAPDADSVQVLEAYLDRAHPDWREDISARAAGPDLDAESTMNRHLALEILGLEGEPDKKTIIRAHRALMQKLHPDRGGSSYLAQKINAAKDFLLEQL